MIKIVLNSLFRKNNKTHTDVLDKFLLLNVLSESENGLRKGFFNYLLIA